MAYNKSLTDSLFSLLTYSESLLVQNLTLMQLVRLPATEHEKEQRSHARQQIERRIEPIFLGLHSLAQRGDWEQFHTILESNLKKLLKESGSHNDQ